jgi:hypothetical protein
MHHATTSMNGILIAGQILDSGTLYLIIGAALIFGACAYAAKRILRQLTLKQIGLSVLITVVTIGVIWGFLALGTRKHDTPAPLPDVNEPTPLLQPTPD